MTDRKRRKQVVKEAKAAFNEAVEGWMPKPKELKIGDRVILSGSHPYAGKAGVVTRFETNTVTPESGKRVVVKIDGGCFVYVSQADQWRKD